MIKLREETGKLAGRDVF